jgi:hypothetical protein
MTAGEHLPALMPVAAYPRAPHFPLAWAIEIIPT